MMRAELHTTRLILRHFQPDHAVDLHNALNDYDIAKWLIKVAYPFSMADAVAFTNNPIADGALPYGIWTRDGQFVGGVQAKPQLGFWLARDHTGKGYATEAGRAILAERFYQSDDHEDVSGYLLGNAASRRVLSKLGYAYSGRCSVETRVLSEAIYHEMTVTREGWWASEGLPITTPRLVIRPVMDNDWQQFQSIAGRPELARMLCSVSAPWGDADVQNWLYASRYRCAPGFRLAVCLPEGRVIGSIGLGGADNPSLSYFLDRAYWGLGLITEALQGFLNWTDRRFALSRITADAFADNPASSAVLKKIGFVQSGRALGRSLAREHAEPVIQYERICCAERDAA